MATVEITIRDDHGDFIVGQARRTYQLNLGNQSFNAIETAVGTLKKRAVHLGAVGTIYCDAIKRNALFDHNH